MAVFSRARNPAFWATAPAGTPLADGLALSLEDFAAFGQSLLDARTPSGRRTIAPRWFADTLGLRPEHVLPEGFGVHLAFTCEVVERLGNSTYLFGQCCGIDNFKLLLAGDNAFKPYQQLDVFFSPEHCLVFNAEGNRISK